jgi:hypothetical protein
MRIYRAASGAIERVPLEGPRVSLAELQRAVGGYIEAIPGVRIGRAFCNENGRNLGLPYNRLASIRFRQSLVGDVVELEAGERHS